MFSTVLQARSVRPGILSWIGCLFVSAAACILPMTVEASCGDYLYGNGGHHRKDVGLDLESSRLSREALLNHEDSSSVPTLPKTRCSGPFCHQTPPVPYESPQPDHPRSSSRELCFEPIVTGCVIEDWFRLRISSDTDAEFPDLSRLDRPPQVA